ncbi:hypothetical protein CRUP_032147 [Coryphaenoides rupestris]|nr:hypothetical protein CRUP_032147 [Coryphaenoides rupestris]
MDVLRSAIGEGTRGCEAGGDLSEALKEEAPPSRPKRRESSSSSSSSAVSLALQALGGIMQHPLGGEMMMGEMMAGAAHHYAAPAEQHTGSSHRYRSFMIEEILTDHPERRRNKDATPAVPGGRGAAAQVRRPGAAVRPALPQPPG